MAIFLLLAASMIGASVLGLLHRARPVGGGRAHDRDRMRPATSAGLAVLVPTTAILLYAWLGRPDAITAPPADAVTAMAEERTARLASRLVRQGDDVASLRLLARSFEQLGQLRDAASARARLATLLPDDPEALDDLAEALSTVQGGSYVGEPVAVVRRALAIDPANDRALAMAANEAAERDDLPAAIDFWNRMLSRAPADSALERSLRLDIERAEAALAANRSLTPEESRKPTRR